MKSVLIATWIPEAYISGNEHNQHCWFGYLKQGETNLNSIAIPVESELLFSGYGSVPSGILLGMLEIS